MYKCIYVYYMYYICKKPYPYPYPHPYPYHHLRIQGGHFLKSALNRVLTLPYYRSRRELSNRTGIMDLQNKSNILVANQ